MDSTPAHSRSTAAPRRCDAAIQRWEIGATAPRVALGATDGDAPSPTPRPSQVGIVTVHTLAAAGLARLLERRTRAPLWLHVLPPCQLGTAMAQQALRACDWIVEDDTCGCTGRAGTPCLRLRAKGLDGENRRPDARNPTDSAAAGVTLPTGAALPTLADALLRMLDASPAGSTSEAPAGPALTPRQRQIAALVARGLTNKQIAHQLALAPATVKLHVAATLRGLGAGRRAEIAAQVAAGRLTPPSPFLLGAEDGAPAP